MAKKNQQDLPQTEDKAAGAPPSAPGGALLNEAMGEDREAEALAPGAAVPEAGAPPAEPEADDPPTESEAPAPPAEPEAPAGHSFSFGGPGCLDLAVFCRQFATLIEAGIPALDTFQMLARRTTNARLRQAVEATARGIGEGQMIHQAMAASLCVYTPLVISIVRAGESAGRLQDSLIRLAEIMEAKARIRRRLISASIYPLLALGVALGVVTLILVKAIPIYATVYNGKENLPPATQFVIELSQFFQDAWWIVIGGLALLLAGLRWGFAATPGGRRVRAWIALHVPGLKGVSRKLGVARSTRTLGGLVAAGIPLTEALAITAEANENALIADALDAARGHVERGERMAAPLAQAGVFPPLAVDMLGIGEETGTLDRMLAKVADIYDAEVESTLNGLSSIIEPLLIVLLGGVVIFIALAVLLPCFNLANRIQE